VLKDAVEKYEIRIEAWSSSYDSIESRRTDAIALWNIAGQAKQMWLEVNMKDLFERIANTFEWIDTTKLFDTAKPMWLPEMLPQQPNIPTM
jgi:hypothetical protein